MKLRTLTASLIAFCFLGSAAFAAPVAEVSSDAAGVYFLTADGADYQLTVTGPEGYYHRHTSSAPAFSVADSEGVDGTYTYELVAIPAKIEREAPTQVIEKRSQSGAFTLAGGTVVDPKLSEQGFEKAQVFATDLITQGSACIGFDCTSSESFGFDTLRLKENNLRVHFDDTSSSASFPGNDWRLTANDSSNGGGNVFAIEDVTAGRTPFKVEAGAIANALYVSSAGDVGVGTSTPVVEVHAVDGNSPTYRLEQNGSSGFTPQTWDIAGNETNFFIRDVTNGSKLPFRIKPGAPDNSIFINASGHVGIGTDSPSDADGLAESYLEVRSANGDARLGIDSADGAGRFGELLFQRGNVNAWSLGNDNTQFYIYNYTRAANDITIDKTTGNVAIGASCLQIATYACTVPSGGGDLNCVTGACP